MKRHQSGIVLVLACLVVGGCAQTQFGPVAPASQGSTASIVVAAVPPAPTTALEYYPLAKSGGDSMTPKPGSTLRTKLMDSARAQFKLDCKFFVHSLTVNQEVAYGSIEPYPKGTGNIRNVTWVLWRDKWTVVSDVDTRRSTPTYGTGGGASFGDANGDGDSGPLYPSVPAGANPSAGSTGHNTEWHWIEGYTRKDGTSVSGHYRRTE
ncbi:MAG: hypothetical protein Q8S43_07775 [Actinomycetota bacterium]|nr:hypothetical protein [Actinomycetota bacterium]MDP3630832.1 hypothetical protein [Actinomycetota bacterium]